MKEDKKETSRCGYPVAILDDIHMYFVHYPNFKFAEEKWYERCHRIKWDNLYYIMTQRDGCSEEDLKNFDNFPSVHKAVFTAEKREDIKSSYYISRASKDGQVIDLNTIIDVFTDMICRYEIFCG